MAVLLVLGVSHTNELQKGQAVSYLMRCALEALLCEVTSGRDAGVVCPGGAIV